MRELVYKYADVYTKPGKPVAYDIKHKIELLGPESLYVTTGCKEWVKKKLQEVKNHLK